MQAEGLVCCFIKLYARFGVVDVVGGSYRKSLKMLQVQLYRREGEKLFKAPLCALDIAVGFLRNGHHMCKRYSWCKAA